MSKKFTHLHVHSEYSLLDGLSNLKKLTAHIKENGMDSVAVTDHGAMYGIIEFYQEAIKQEIKPIIGVEAYTTNVNHKERPDRKDFKNFHLLLLAKNKEGYQNLMKLTSIAHMEGYYYRPRFDKETLTKYSKGIICTSACAQGELAQKILEGNFEEAKKVAQWHLDLFGKDYYLEIQRHRYGNYINDIQMPEVKTEILQVAENEKIINEGVVKISRELGIPLVATNDAHYVKKEDANAQDALLCIATAKNVSDAKRLRMIDAPTFYLTSPEEMYDIFSDLPDACENTSKVAEKCSVEIALGKWFFPKFDVPEGLSADEYLRKEARARLPERITECTKEVKERLEYELNTIIQKGYAPYFLIVMDMVNWANSKGIITNTRGSAAGSLVSFCLGITTVNPITYNLPFERFLNPFRPSPPDIDFDVSDNRREEILKYIADTYGHNHVAQICTFGRMLARGGVRDVARVLGYPYETGDRISKLIPLGSQGFPMTIEKALAQTPDLGSLYDTDQDAKKIIDLVKQIEGTARHISVHAAGVVVAPTELTDFTPLQLEPSGDKIITQYEMHACESVGLIKFDILGIRNLSILGSAIEIVNKERNKKVDIRQIPLDDKKTFDMLSRGETMGTFQLGGSGMTRYLKELRPTRIEDLMVMVALYRPGPIDNINEYIARKHKEKPASYLHPKMKDFLDKTFGVLVYQDDILLTAIEVAGYSWDEVDKFRKAIGKKIPEEMAKQHEIFTKGCQEHGGMSKDEAESLWKLFEPFQGYGFNKAHAASYGLVSYQTAYMKANYPVEYMTALLTAESGDSEKISAAINECRRMGIKVLPPDINESEIGFTIVPDDDSLGKRAIRFGFSAIKNVGNAAIEAIIEAKSAEAFTSFADFLSRADARRVNKKVLESLIKVGALSKFGSRAALLSTMDEIRGRVTKPKNVGEGQQGLFAAEEIKTQSIEVISINENIAEFSEEELQVLERQLLGFSLSAKPLAELVGALSGLATHKIYEISPQELPKDKVKIAGVVTQVRLVVTKKTGSEMAFVRIEDETGGIDAVIFPKLYRETRDLWVDYKPLLVTGRIDLRDESPNLLVESVETADNVQGAPTMAPLYIKIPKNVHPEALNNLKELLKANPGLQKATLFFEGSQKKVVVPFGISWNESLGHKISEILVPQE